MDPPATCAACGSKLVLMLEIPQHGQPREQDHTRTLYFRCERCEQIKIVEG